MTDRASGTATATKPVSKKASVQVTPEAYDRVVMVANHYHMTQRGAASLMLLGVSAQGIQEAVSQLNSRLPGVSGSVERRRVAGGGGGGGGGGANFVAAAAARPPVDVG